MTTDYANITSIDQLHRLPGLPNTLFTILFSITALLALLGNLFALLVLKYGNRSRPTDLHPYLMNVSVSDITMALFCIPFTFSEFTSGYWKWPRWFCPTVQLVQFTSVFVTIYSLVLIGVDRCLAIWFPLMMAKGCLVSKRKWILLLLWLAGLLFGAIQYTHVTTYPLVLNTKETYYGCSETWSEQQIKLVSVMLFSVTFGLPVVLLLVIYGLLAYKVGTFSLSGEVNIAQNEALSRTKMKVFKLLAIVVLLFIICWLPKQLWNLLFRYDHAFWSEQTSHLSDTAYICITLTFHWLAMANSIVNPFVYYFMSTRFRADYAYLARKIDNWMWANCQMEEEETEEGWELRTMANGRGRGGRGGRGQIQRTPTPMPSRRRWSSRRGGVGAQPRGGQLKVQADVHQPVTEQPGAGSNTSKEPLTIRRSQSEHGIATSNTSAGGGRRTQLMVISAEARSAPSGQEQFSGKRQLSASFV